jgi:hypothetical protein
MEVLSALTARHFITFQITAPQQRPLALTRVDVPTNDANGSRPTQQSFRA